MSNWMQQLLESKRAARRQAAALPFARKLDLLERLRERSLLLASSPLRQRARRAKREDFDAFLAASPEVPPLPGDEL
jgi:hypothetical protein